MLTKRNFIWSSTKPWPFSWFPFLQRNLNNLSNTKLVSLFDLTGKWKLQVTSYAECGMRTSKHLYIRVEEWTEFITNANKLQVVACGAGRKEEPQKLPKKIHCEWKSRFSAVFTFSKCKLPSGALESLWSELWGLMAQRLAKAPRPL